MSTVVVPAAQIMRVAAENPERELDRAIAEYGHRADGEIILFVDFSLVEYWTEAKISVALTAFFWVRRANSGIDAVKACVFPTQTVAVDLQALAKTNIDLWLTDLDVPVFNVDAPIPLQPVAIPKPWGQEIWYTGIERRGVAEVGDPNKKIPLPWLLAIAPQRLGVGAEPILLKILDPLPTPVFGDLYFELHQQKQEIYVVTAVDKGAWPDGKGAIRFGFDPALRTQYGDDRRFLADYFAAVRNYRRVRVEIDILLDVMRSRDDVELNAPVSAVTLQAWLLEVPHPLRAEEEALRHAMERFTQLRPLAIGDVVKVPCLLPHALQHGVRTVEFQTPVYERLILSFAQKVLTQADWDTEASASVLQLDPPLPAPFPVTAGGAGWVEERIVAFDNFEVRRVSLQPGAKRELSIAAGYGLGIVVGGGLQLGDHNYRPDDGVLLPGGLRTALENTSAATTYFLLALPLAARG